jgi:hypothetical protein
MPICCNPTHTDTCKGEVRMQQYINGFCKFFEYSHLLNEHNVDIIVFDNTIDKNDDLPQELIHVIPSNVKIINDHVNHYGCKNKGAGLIEMWKYLRYTIQEYDYLIHFEPRQLLIDFSFIEFFLSENCNLFTYGGNRNHFNTGLFCISCPILFRFIDYVDINLITNNYASIEYIIYDFFVNHNIPFEVCDKMNLIWYPYQVKEIIM